MCGGSIELLPCSHVGHLHRDRLPFQLEGRGEINDKKRLAEVWFREYKNFFYTIFPNAKTENPGDLREEEDLVQKLNCKTIYWYWETVYPDSIWPVNGERYGEVSMCNHSTGFLWNNVLQLSNVRDDDPWEKQNRNIEFIFYFILFICCCFCSPQFKGV